MTWQSQILDREDAQGLGAEVLNLQVFDERTHSMAQTTIGSSQTPLISIELLVPLDTTTDGNGPGPEAANAKQ